jgi:hypothetical protein
MYEDQWIEHYKTLWFDSDYEVNLEIQKSGDRSS